MCDLSKSGIPLITDDDDTFEGDDKWLVAERLLRLVLLLLFMVLCSESLIIESSTSSIALSGPAT